MAPSINNMKSLKKPQRKTFSTIVKEVKASSSKLCSIGGCVIKPGYSYLTWNKGIYCIYHGEELLLPQKGEN